MFSILKSSFLLTFLLSFLTTFSSAYAQGSIQGQAWSVDISNSEVPACKQSSSDSDGDGWGWENNTSCKVGGSFTYSSHPICELTNSDPDGDGWGWENNKSCKVDEEIETSENEEFNNNPQVNDSENSISISPEPGSRLNSDKVDIKINFAGYPARRVKIRLGKNIFSSSALNVDVSNGSILNTGQVEITDPSEIFSYEASNLPTNSSNILATVIVYSGTSSPEVINFTYTAASSNSSQDTPPNTPFEEPEISPARPIVSSPEELNSLPSSSKNCHLPWNKDAMNLDNRVQRLLESPYRAGFGADTTGGTRNLKVVTNPAASGSGTYADVISKASSGDYIIFDPSHSVYLSDITARQAVLPGNITIDGQLPSGRFVTLRSINTKQQNMFRMANGNNIIANINLEQSNEAAAIAVGHGENYWLHCFEISDANSTVNSTLSIGSQISNVENSADNVTVSKYTVLEQDKGFLIMSAGKSCELPNGRFDPQAKGSDRTAQRRAHITIIDSNLGASTRNVLNKGAFIDIIGTYIHGRVENLITEFGGQTALRCSYIDSSNVRYAGIRAQGGRYTTGEHVTAASECPKQSEVFLDNNTYRQKQKEFSNESENPRIDISGSDIGTRALGHMTNGIANWNNPASGKPVFNRPYGNLNEFCDIPEPG